MIRFMLPAIGSTMMHAMSVPPCANAASTAREIVVGQHDRFVGDRGRHAGGRWLPERQRAGAGLHEQAVAMAVVAAFELHDLAAAGESARKPQRRHRRFGARRNEPHHLDRRQQAAQRFGHLDFDLGRRAEGQALSARCRRPPSRPPDARGRGSPVPTSRRSRCSACRRRPTDTRPARARKSAACRRRSGRRGPAS